MIFRFLQYVRPIWYYNLRPLKDNGYFPDEIDALKAGFKLTLDKGFRSSEAQLRDFAWRAFQMGCISVERKSGIHIWKSVNLPLQDEYRFIRKNFHYAWVYYVFLLRLITLNNPIKEILAFLRTHSVRREDFLRDPVMQKDYQLFESDLIRETPLVSVIIPTLNRYEYLKNVLKDFENQTYSNFEVIVIDQTDNYQADFYAGWNLHLTHEHQQEKALWKARNHAIRKAQGEFILMSEDDIEIPPDFIENHLKAIDYFKCDVSCGVFFPKHSVMPKQKSYFRYADQFATGNAMLRRELFAAVGLFDRQFEKQRMGDGEFGLRLYLAGFVLISNPISFCYDIKAPSGGLRQMGSWDAWRPKSLFAPRPVPSVLYLSRKYFGDKLSIYALLIAVLPSVVPYKFKQYKIFKLISFLLLPLLLPVIGYQVYKSWLLASRKIKQGALIDVIADKN